MVDTCTEKVAVTPIMEDKSERRRPSFSVLFMDIFNAANNGRLFV